MSNKTITPAAAIVGAALVGGLGAAQAAENPFAAEPLQSGYIQLAEGEGKCGEATGGEGKCGESGEMEGEGGEGKCGEGKCGGEM